MVSIQNGHFVPLYFNDIFDPETKRTKVRMVDVTSEWFKIARAYMRRLVKEDFEDPHELAKFAATAGVSVETFRDEFDYLIGADRLYRTGNGGEALPDLSELTTTSGIAPVGAGPSPEEAQP